MSIEPTQGEPTPQPPPSRPVQFRLADLLLLITWLAIGFAVFTQWHESAIVRFSLLTFALAAWKFRRFMEVPVLVITLVGATALAGIQLFVVLRVPSRQSATVPTFTSRADSCQANLLRIGRALAAYRAEHGALPPLAADASGGQALHSWRVLILPYLDEQDLYNQFHLNEPWDSEHNLRVAEHCPDVYRCHADFPSGPTATSYLAIVGDQSAWQSHSAGDSTPSILVAEVANSGIAWSKPTDLDVSCLTLGVNPSGQRGVSSRHEAGAWVLLADFSTVKQVPSHVELLDGSEQ